MRKMEKSMKNIEEDNKKKNKTWKDVTGVAHRPRWKDEKTKDPSEHSIMVEHPVVGVPIFQKSKNAILMFYKIEII
jgi:hypothetical protein